MRNILLDAGPFIHLNQIKQIKLLRKFPSLYTPASVISELKPGKDIATEDILRWKNLKIISVKGKNIPQIEKVILKFGLHKGESDVIYLASKIPSPVILTDDLDARRAAKILNIEVHGSVGIIAYAFGKKWISLQEAEESLILLHEQSSLFITSTIIKRAIDKIKRSG